MTLQFVTIDRLSDRDLDSVVKIHTDSWLSILQRELGTEERKAIEAEVRNQYHSRREVFPEGQIAGFVAGVLIGSISSIAVNTETVDDLPHTYAEMTDRGYLRNHVPNGNTLVCPTVTVHEKFRGFGLAKDLVRAQARLALERDMDFLYAYSRPVGFRRFVERHRETPIEAYVGLKRGSSLQDPVLGMHYDNGAHVARIIPDGRPADLDSRGHIVVMEYAKTRWNSVK